VTVDLRRPEGQEIVRAQAARGGVLLENFRPGTRPARAPLETAKSSGSESAS
jgi:hypothetical protein